MKLLIAIIAVEAVTEILVHSPLFAWLRRLARPIRLFDCGWCLSVWVAAGAVMLITLDLWWVLALFAIARLSNLFHEIFGRLRG